jgi:hypothetical protein
MYLLCLRLVLSILSDFAVALATVDWSAFSRLEGDFGFLTALGAYRREHLTPGPVAVAIITVALCFPGFAAGGTALGLVGIALGLEELLFLGAEGEFSPTVGAGELLVLKTHWMTSSLVIVG